MAAPTIIAPNMSGVDLFEATLNEFKATLTRDQLAGFKPCNHIELEIYTVQLQEAQRKRGFYRAMNRIRPFIDGLNGYSKIIELFTQAEKMVCFVWVGDPNPLYRSRDSENFKLITRFYSGSYQVLTAGK